MIPSLKRVVPARIVLNVAISINVEPVDMNIGMAFTPTLYKDFRRWCSNLKACNYQKTPIKTHS